MQDAGCKMQDGRSNYLASCILHRLNLPNPKSPIPNPRMKTKSGIRLADGSRFTLLGNRSFPKRQAIVYVPLLLLRFIG